MLSDRKTFKCSTEVVVSHIQKYTEKAQTQRVEQPLRLPRTLSTADLKDQINL